MITLLWDRIKEPTGVLAACLLLAAFAMTRTVSANPSAQTLVETTANHVISALNNESEMLRENPERLYALVDEIMLPHFDFVRMSKRVLGKHWRKASPEQQSQFVGEFRTLLVRTYATALAKYSGESITVLPQRSEPDTTEVTVRAEVSRPGGVPIPIHFAMHLNGERWQVHDVLVNGISLVINHRSSFASEIQRNGLNKLIDRLKRLNQPSTS